MRKSIFMLILITLLLLSSACGLLENPPTPSAPLEAVPLENSEATVVPATGEADTSDPQSTAPAISEAEMEEATGGDTAEDGGETTSAGGRRIYTLQPGASQVRFELDEDLRGRRATVVGSSDQVAGEIGFDLNDLSGAEVGVIQINARTLATDNNFRNRAIQNEILDTGVFEFITFTPTAINGLPASVQVGEEVQFTIDGELTIRDVTHPVTFAVVATPVSEAELAGTATATVSREAYGLRIPQVPNVANVEDEVDLTLDFMAVSEEA